MAKQASTQAQTKQEKLAMVIVSVKSPKTGAYTFKKRILPKEEALKLLAESNR